ncbi:hypothetical protein BGZ83_000829, partial [Gryganskiella cystojenkinii]
SHKLNPSGGVGAMSAMHDAICLANWINVLSSASLQDTEIILREYHEERYPIAVGAFKKSQLFATINEKKLSDLGWQCGEIYSKTNAQLALAQDTEGEFGSSTSAEFSGEGHRFGNAACSTTAKSDQDSQNS